MENPAITQLTACNCATDKTQVEKCYNNDPRWVKVTVPYAQSAILFVKGTLRVVCNADACADACPPAPFKPNVPQPENKVILKGYGISEEQLCTDAYLSHQCVTLLPANTSVNGMTYPDFDAFCAAITMILTDCNCKCN